MAEITVEVDDKGNIGKLPDELQRFLDKQINESYKRGAAKVEADLTPKLMDPAKAERMKTLEDENNRFKEEQARANKNYEEADRLKDERFTKQLGEKDTLLTSKDQEIARRQDRLRGMLGSEIKAHAIAAGARAESLPELVKLLGADVDLDADLNAFVKGADGKPAAGKDGKPITVEGLVTQYLAEHPHHVGSRRGQNGGARGGATFAGVKAGGDDPIAEAEENPTSRNIVRAMAAVGRAKG
jgi:hypothetical protein